MFLSILLIKEYTISFRTRFIVYLSGIVFVFGASNFQRYPIDTLFDYYIRARGAVTYEDRLASTLRNKVEANCEQGFAPFRLPKALSDSVGNHTVRLLYHNSGGAVIDWSSYQFCSKEGRRGFVDLAIERAGASLRGESFNKCVLECGKR
jgi:hypothetical protein